MSSIQSVAALVLVAALAQGCAGSTDEPAADASGAIETGARYRSGISEGVYVGADGGFLLVQADGRTSQTAVFLAANGRKWGDWSVGPVDVGLTGGVSIVCGRKSVDLALQNGDVVVSAWFDGLFVARRFPTHFRSADGRYNLSVPSYDGAKDMHATLRDTTTNETLASGIWRDEWIARYEIESGDLQYWLQLDRNDSEFSFVLVRGSRDGAHQSGLAALSPLAD